MFSVVGANRRKAWRLLFHDHSIRQTCPAGSIDWTANTINLTWKTPLMKAKSCKDQDGGEGNPGDHGEFDGATSGDALQ
jgi:hypothetical protein